MTAIAGQIDLLGELATTAGSTAKPRTKRSLGQRFWENVDLSGECWLWTGSTQSQGYGRIKARGVEILAHRWSYMQFVGAIEPGLAIDHLCHRPDGCEGGKTCPHRRCVNPAHLQAVTSRLNTLRGNGPGGRYARRTHCKWGHVFDQANTYIRPDRGGHSRICRRCQANRKATRAVTR